MRGFYTFMCMVMLAIGPAAWGQATSVRFPLLGTEPLISHQPPMAEISWQTEARDLGFRNVGEMIEIPFRFRNTGAEYLRIKGVSCSSSQGSGSCKEVEVAPGAYGEILIRITPARPGAFQFFFTVTSNTRAIAHVLTIRGIGR